ncbi:MAG: sulfatase [Verrucomicrobiales bacterium]|nr:sulfatase [Verrucomicrobiales bacterium]
MNFRFLLVALAIPITGFAENSKPKNVLLICVDDLRPELNCYGVEYIHSPNIDALAARGRIFTRHYVQAPTCGASRYTLLTGTYGPSSNGSLFSRAKKERPNPSLPAFLRKQGFTTVSVGKVSHHPGGRGGPDWNDDAIPEMPDSWDRHLLPAGEWKHPRGWMHGLANGEIRKNAKDMDVFQALEGPDTIYPDGPSTDVALEQLHELAKSEEPFFLAFGILRPHLPFGAPKKYLDLYYDAELPPIPHPEKPEGKTTWHGSGEFMKYNRWGRNPNEDGDFATDVRKHYAACVTYADAQVGRMLDRLKSLGLQDETLVILWGDHGWHLGEHAIWGKHALFEESLRSPLIIAPPTIEKPGEKSDSIVETLDVYPTICDLLEMDKPNFLDGTSLVPILENPTAPGHPAVSYKGNAATIRTDSHRLISHKNGEFLALYDHTSEAGETENVAESKPELAKKLLAELQARLGKK